MSETLYLKPATGIKVRKENGAHVKPSGEKLPNNSYYRRRFSDGDLVMVNPPRKKEAK